MEESELRAALGKIPLSGLRFFSSLGSTNDEAAAWVEGGAADLSLVVADEQTAGRGRSGSRWFTLAGTALAFSLILRPSAADMKRASRMAGLGALAIAEALSQLGLRSTIKWPNDVLLGGRKVAGVLVESIWTGAALEASIVGMGINVLKASAPSSDAVAFPATSLEAELGSPIDRAQLLSAVLQGLLAWRSKLATDEFMTAWESRLAFRGEQVTLTRPGAAPLTGVLFGLDADGGLRLTTGSGVESVASGEIHLRPVNDRIT